LLWEIHLDINIHMYTICWLHT